MPEATERPWGYVHHKGLDQHLVGAVLENVAIVEDRHGNAKENADLIVKAVNAHDALVQALEAVEWAGEPYYLHARCPVCYAARNDSGCSDECFIDHGHTDDCQLATALEAAK